jgi:glyoxylase-like metal-dependent hydrolase (beta-lactamase superfamily II)
MSDEVLAVTGFFHEPSKTVSYVVSDHKAKRAAIIDPVMDFDAGGCLTDTGPCDAIIEYVKQEHLVIDWILETHLHEDHLSGARHVRAALGGVIAIGEGVRAVQAELARIFNLPDFACDGSQFDRLLENGAGFNIGDIPARAYAMPGHSGACMSILVGDTVFVGDTLLMPDNGTARADMPGGDAGELYRSIRALYGLPPETRIFPGHDPEHKGRAPAWETTIALELEKNVHIKHDVQEADFVAYRTRRDRGLSKPDHYYQALQFNMNGGALPPPENNGVSYFRIPVNALTGAAKPFKLRLVH